MLYSQEVVQKDLNELISKEFIPYSELKGKSILITGACGMLAYYFTCTLAYLNEKNNYGIKIFALVRNRTYAEEKFGELVRKKEIELVIQDVCKEICLNKNVDYIVHAAGNASAYAIVHNPLEIIDANVLGTRNVMNFAEKKGVAKVVFLSTREVYGKTNTKKLIEETDMGVLDPLDTRSCYPESKRMAEQILKSYQLIKRIPINILRIAHSYGPGMKTHNDGRVMADFIGNAVAGKNILLKSKGDARRAFCYITDVVAAIFLVMLKGEDGEAYNVANETEEYTIRDVAEMVAHSVSTKKIKVIYDIEDNQLGYCKYQRVGLDTTKIGKLGWFPKVKLADGIARTLRSFE